MDSLSPPPSTDLPELPAAYRVERELARRPGVRVLQARRSGVGVGERVVVRVEERSEEVRSELAVLGTVRASGLARLVDHGSLAGGASYVAREWVEGRPLAELAGERSSEDLGRIVARLCPALAHLHERGFAHGDLKAGNVVVREGDAPVLTDFGLATQAAVGRRGAASGSLFHIPPEVLLGRPYTPRGDLFALGVLLFGLLARTRVDARTFYGRFPAREFLDAVEVAPTALPEWARDVVVALLARDPARRPVSAAWVGHVLAARLGEARGRGREARPELEWPVLEGREAFVDGRRRLWREPDAQAVERWSFGDARELARVAEAVALRVALAGEAVRPVDLDRELAGLADGASVDRWARARGLPGGGGLVVAWGAERSRWAGRALRALAASVRQAARRGRDVRLLVCDHEGERPELEPCAREAFPALDEALVRSRLAAWLPGSDGEALDVLAARLDAECGGSAVRAEALLQAVADEGWIRLDARGLRLRRGPLPDRLGRGRGPGIETLASRLSGGASRLLTALVLWEGPADRSVLAALTSLAPAGLQAAVEEAVGLRLVRAERDAAGETRFALARARPARAALGLDPGEWRARNAVAAEIAARSERPWLQWLYRVRAAGPADSATVAGLRAALEDLRSRGSAELALDLLGVLRDDARREGEELPALLRGELALTWATLHELDLALREVDELEASRAEAPAVRALVERARAAAATLRGEHAAALRHCERALERDPGDPALRAEALLAEARLLYETGRQAELAALVERIDAQDELPRVVAINARSLAALAAFRRGDVEAGRAGLRASVAEAERLGEPTREAADRVNLGVLERHAGRLDDARGHLQRAIALFDDAGRLPDVAQAQTVLGAVLRDAGELAQAGRVLEEAVEARERLGDASGAERARGVLGLVLAERGHARAAATALGQCAAARAAAGATADAERLVASAGEMEARLGVGRDAGGPSGSDDPRTALALARARWLRGDRDGCGRLLAAARARARELGRPADEEDARVAEELLAGRGTPAPGELATARAREDATVLEALAPERFDAAVALDLARALEARGRDDRAARLALAVATRGAAELRAGARAVARACLERCAAGTDAAEREHLTRHLLGVPDPFPEDLAGDPDLDDEDPMDMDVLSLLEINQRLVEQQDLPRLLGSIVESALQVTGAERGFLVLEEDGELSLDLALDSRRGAIDEPEVEVSHSLLREVLERGEPMRLSNAADDPLLGAAPSVTALALRSVLCWPFPVSEGVRGVIYVDNRMTEGAFDSRAERLLGLLAGQAALAIRQVRRLEEIRRLNAKLGSEVVHKETDLLAARRALKSSGSVVPVGGLVGDSAPMRAVHALLHRVAPARISVLVCGPSGTGKELAARAVHELSPWSSGPFVSENCAALPAGIIESELFGYVAGAFTGADRERPGLFERASGGTLFLDEIGELPLELQAKLLRVLETLEVRRLGGGAEIAVDFRLVCATNRDLADEVHVGRFREDLLYRVDGVRVQMPSLAERLEDVPLLVDHFLRLQAARDGVRRACSPEVLRRLSSREWPGNVRELANEVTRLCVLSDGDLVEPDLVRAPGAAREERSSGAVRPLADLERQAILDALEETGGDKRRAAELLGISRTKVYERLKEWRERA